MNFLYTQALLVKAAIIHQEQSINFSREDLQKSIAELKYLSSQKKIPRLSLRRHVITLDDQLKGLYELERRLLRQNREESAKILALKRQIYYLKHKFTTIKDPHLPKKVEHLSHLLGECLAHLTIEKEVKQKTAEIKTKPSLENIGKVLTQLQLLQQRINALKHELDIDKQLPGKDHEQLKQIESQIALLEQKLNLYLNQETSSIEAQKEKYLVPPQPARGGEIKHTFLIGQSLSGKSMEEALKLKPPQPIRK